MLSWGRYQGSDTLDHYRDSSLQMEIKAGACDVGYMETGGGGGGGEGSGREYTKNTIIASSDVAKFKSLPGVKYWVRYSLAEAPAHKLDRAQGLSDITMSLSQ